MEALVKYIDDEELRKLCVRYYKKGNYDWSHENNNNMREMSAAYLSKKMNKLQDKMEKFVTAFKQDFIGFLWKDNNGRYQLVWCFYKQDIADTLRKVADGQGAEEHQDFGEWYRLLKQLKIL